MGFTVWWIYLPDVLNFTPVESINPEWINAVRETVVERVRSDGLEEEAARGNSRRRCLKVLQWILSTPLG